jgi:hypothetical protein
MGGQHVQRSHLVLLVIRILETSFPAALLQNLHKILHHPLLVIFQLNVDEIVLFNSTIYCFYRQVQPKMQRGFLTLQNLKHFLAIRQLAEVDFDDFLE